MKYRNSLSIHFKPGKSRVAIPLLKELWNGEGTIMRRIGKEAALIGMYKDVDTLEELKSLANMKVADKLDPMIIDGSVNHHLWRHNLGDAHHSNVVKVFGTTFKSMFAYEDVEGAIEENINIATQNGKKMTHWRKLFESPNGPRYIMTIHYDSLDDCADDLPVPAMRKNLMLMRSRISDLQETVWMKVD